MNKNRSIPHSLLFKMFIGGKFYVCQICIILITFLTRLMIFAKLNVEIFSLILVIVIVTIAILIMVWVKDYRKLQLLKDGILTEAEYSNSESTHFNQGYQQIIKHYYTFYAQDGISHRVFKYSTSNEPDIYVKVLYSKEKNREALVVNGLPGEPQIDKNGNISSVRITDNFIFYVLSLFPLLFSYSN